MSTKSLVLEAIHEYETLLRQDLQQDAKVWSDIESYAAETGLEEYAPTKLTFAKFLLRMVEMRKDYAIMLRMCRLMQMRFLGGMEWLSVHSRLKDFEKQFRLRREAMWLVMAPLWSDAKAYRAI